MKNTIVQRFSILMIAASFCVAIWSAAPRVTSYALQTDVATPAPTEAATETPTVAPTHIELPAVNWQDVGIYKKAMKQGHEGDVDKFVDSNRYLIVATLTLGDDAIIRGSERVRYTNHSTDTLKEIVFRLYPNAPALSGHMDVANVTLNGKAVQPSLSQRDSVLSVPLTQPLAQGQAAELTLDFDVVMKGGADVSYGRFGYFENVVSGTAWYPTLSVYDQGLGWWRSLPSPQGDPAYTESGLYDVRLTVPAGVTSVMSGKEVETRTNADGSIMHRGVTGPMRDHAFMASERYTITPKDVDGTRINAVHYKDDGPNGTEGTDNVLKYAEQAVEAYNSTFGDYPFAEFNIVENPTPTGVEFPGVIQIAERAWGSNAGYLETLIAHETGHQWFYSLIGNNQVEHPWLDESLTSYLEIVYIRAVYKDNAETTNYINRFLAEYSGYIAFSPDQPLDLPVDSFSGAGYGAIVYAKGPLFFVALDRTVGLETAYKALHTYFERYEYKVVTSADLEKTFEEVSGKDLTAIFKKWVTEGNTSPTATPKPIAMVLP